MKDINELLIEELTRQRDELISIIQNQQCEITESNKNIKQLCKECWRCKVLEEFGTVDKNGSE